MSDDLDAQRFSDPEMGRLMGLINELLEGQVVAMVVARGAKFSLALPHGPSGSAAEALELLRDAKWDELYDRVVGATS